MITKQNIIISPLNWGLGHANRCIPIIEKYIKNGHYIIIAASGNSGEYLRKKYPELEYIELPDYNVKYPKNGKIMPFYMLFSSFGYLKAIKKEKKLLENYLEGKNIDLIISDNRFGMHSQKVKSVFITHQIRIHYKYKIIENIVYRLNRRFINKFDECWIPDNKSEGILSADLSHNIQLKIPYKYIGFLNRFSNTKAVKSINKKCEILAIISGPEPQRSLFENIVVDKLIDLNKESVILAGKPLQKEIIEKEKLSIYPHIDDQNFVALIKEAEIIICRAGYTSLMELMCFDKNLVLVPTPGQTEQEYLAENLKSNNKISVYSQKDFKKRFLN